MKTASVIVSLTAFCSLFLLPGCSTPAPDQSLNGRLRKTYGWKGADTTLPAGVTGYVAPTTIQRREAEAAARFAAEQAAAEKKAKEKIAAEKKAQEKAAAEKKAKEKTAPVKKSDEKPAVKAPEVKKEQKKPAGKTGTYVVKKGDSLWKIAVSVYGNGSKWDQIFEANREILKGNADRLSPGTKLVIPNMPEKPLPAKKTAPVKAAAPAPAPAPVKAAAPAPAPAPVKAAAPAPTPAPVKAAAPAPAPAPVKAAAPAPVKPATPAVPAQKK